MRGSEVVDFPLVHQRLMGATAWGEDAGGTAYQGFVAGIAQHGRVIVHCSDGVRRALHIAKVRVDPSTLAPIDVTSDSRGTA